MSTRYVWQKYEVNIDYEEDISDVTSASLRVGEKVKCSTEYVVNNQYITPSGSVSDDIITDGTKSFGYPATTWKYVKGNSANVLYIAKDPKPTEKWWIQHYPTPDNNWMLLTLGENAEGWSNFQYLFIKKIESIGNFIYNVSSDSSSTYPSDGATNYYWYKYLGEDTIDPSAIAYSKNELTAGDIITITVTPTIPTYTSTIYYQYQYSIDGGNNWTDCGYTTNTSITKTIPEGATQFQARVFASDNWGFVSTTYVTGTNLPVYNPRKAYVTVQGTHAPVKKIYTVVNGTIRNVKSGYVTINGKWNKLF